MISVAWRNAFIVLLLAAACLLPALGKITLTEHEVFAAEPAREMLDGGSRVLQYFAGEPRLKKPPGQSWLIAASIKLNHQPSDFAARLPSAIAGAGVAMVAALIGTWTLGRRVGLIAGLMMLTSVGLQQRAHLAEADMALACAVAIANAAIVRPLTQKKRASRAWGLLFWIAVVAGFLLKGPIVFGFTVLPAIVAWVFFRFRSIYSIESPLAAESVAQTHGLEYQAVAPRSARVRPYASALARGPLWWPWILLGLFAIAVWVIAALHSLPFPASEALAKWKHEITDRMAGDIRRDPLVAYVWLIPQATLPWIIFAFAAIGPYRKLKLWQRPAEAFLNCWAICGALMITAIAFKRMHYALPMLLPVILQSAYGFDRILGWWIDGRPALKQAATYRMAMLGWFGTAVAAWIAFWVFFAPRQDSGTQVKKFANEVNAAMPPGQMLYLVNVGEDRAAWYLRRPIRGVDAMPPGPGYAIVQTKDSDPLICDRQGRILAVAETYAPGSKMSDEDRDAQIRLFIHVPDPDVAATQP